MEARWLFDMQLSEIQVVVQPQSIIHSMVGIPGRRGDSTDGDTGYEDTDSIRPLLSPPEKPSGGASDFRKLKEITFEEPDTSVFHGLPLAIRAARAGNHGDGV